MIRIPKFFIYAVYNGYPDDDEPVDWCIIGEGKMWVSVDLDDAKLQVLDEFPDADFLGYCGWVLSGEENKLLDNQYADIFAYDILSQEGEYGKSQ